MGCWVDKADRAIPTLENIEPVLDGRYQTRQQALKKCVAAAFAKGYTVIALQNGGWCAGSRDGWKTFHKYGKSYACKGDGKGGPWANQVYGLTYEWVRTYAP
uniref:Uncharacterized protein LOC100178911 n=1 Tax=Phallusia mammillata TaxID=59560 RepID=A0A6F9DHN7_9ASCI|nr:uncharacterized protein LOC100178911 [Phallusia mammillata]